MYAGAAADTAAVVRVRTEGARADVVMDCGWTPQSLPLALECAASPGVFGLAPEATIEPFRHIVREWLTLHGVAAARREHYGAALRLLGAGVDPTTIVTHRLRLDDVVDGLELVRTRAAAKVVLEHSA